MTIHATLTYPGTGEDSIRVDAPFESPESAGRAIETLLVGGLAAHVRDVRFNAKAGKVEVYASGCTCFGHDLETPEGKRAPVLLAMTFTTKAKDAVASIRRLIAEGASELVVEIIDADEQKAIAAARAEEAKAEAAEKAEAARLAKLAEKDAGTGAKSPTLAPLGEQK